MSFGNPNLIRWRDVPLESMNPLLQRQFISGEQTTVAQIYLKKSCIVPAHSHHNEQISTVLHGELRFTFNPDTKPEEFTVRPGELLVIPANVPHKAEALEDTLNLDIFAPRREDWIAGSDAYLRSK